jgi:hypothetical protein
MAHVCATHPRVRYLLVEATANERSQAPESAAGAWLMDTLYSCVRVLRGAHRASVAFVPAPNAAYGRLWASAPTWIRERQPSTGEVGRGDACEAACWCLYEGGQCRLLVALATLLYELAPDPLAPGSGAAGPAGKGKGK